MCVCVLGYIYVFMYTYTPTYTHECRCPRRPGVSDFPEPGVTVTKSCVTWILGTKFRFSTRAICALNC